MKVFILSLLALLLLGLAYFVYNVYWIYQFNTRLDALGDNLPEKFKVVLPLNRDPNGYFCITAKVNGRQEKTFILDTKATSMARVESLQNLGANFWDKFPVSVKNMYGQKEKLDIYEQESLSIDTLIISKPLFKGITKTNSLHDRLYKDLIGKDILKQFVWKFSVDKNELVLFSSKDLKMFKIETNGFTRIKNGLTDNNSFLKISNLPNRESFYFDLGYQGEISIDEQLYKLLIDKFECKKYLNARRADRTDTAYVFNSMTVEWDGIQIPNCTLRYYPLVNKNLIGAKFIDKFNFILGYQEHKETPSIADLYIQPRKDFERLTHNSNHSDRGFDIDVLNGEPLITLIEIGGKAEKEGLKLKDKVIEINKKKDWIHADSILSGQTSLYLSNNDSIELKVERERNILTVVIE